MKIEQLFISEHEKDVETFWKSKLLELYPSGKINSPRTTDGVFEDESKKLKLIFEFKLQIDLKNKLDQCRPLIQSLFYLKEFEKKGEKLPKIIFIADKDEAFLLHTNCLIKYLDHKINWNQAASSAYKNESRLFEEMIEDKSINPFVFDINTTKFDFKLIQNKINDLNENVKRLVKITNDNLLNVFDYFCKNVLVKNNLTTNQTANLFVELIINPSNNYLHPKKPVLITKSFGEIPINKSKYDMFFDHFDGEQYTHKQKSDLVAIIDRLIEDTTRRRKGEFFTPPIWAKEAMKMIENVFGEDCREKYIFWDPACGTLNLTRDYKFKELYCSTIEESDLKTAEQLGNNPEAVKFQYDFLNDGIIDGKIDIENDTKLPEGLKKAILEGKEIIVFMNPPYGRASSDINGKGASRTGISDTLLNKMMKNENYGGASAQLYTQFLYRLCKLQEVNKQINIGLFSTSLYLTAKTCEKFRNKFFNKFKYEYGMLFKSSHFADVSGVWSIDYTIWKNGETENKNNFSHDIKDIDQDFIIKKYGDKNIYNIDNKKSVTNWIPNKREKLIDCPKLSSALILKDKGQNIKINSIGNLINKGNNVMQNNQLITLLSSGFSDKGAGGISIKSDNFNECISVFAARRCMTGEYASHTNWYDEYIAPTQEILNSSDYKQWNSDAIIYSLFNTKSNQSSLRQITYKDKLWDIKNEFFFMSKDEMIQLAEENYFDILENDARLDNDRYVYTLLKDINLSPDAKEVLEKSKELVRKSFKARKILSENKPEYHLHAWDAGWYQTKLVLKDFYKNDLDEFSKLYKKFENRMREGVYKFGFLK